MLCAARRCLTAVVVLITLLAASVATAAPLSLRMQAGIFTGIQVDGKALPGSGFGGFYVQPYRVVTGENLVAAFPPDPLPTAFSIDHEVTWHDKPTLAITLPADRRENSGELLINIPNLKPHRIHVVRFAHRGEKLGGEYPPILHLRLLDAAGSMVNEQLNVDLYAGSYDWTEQVIPVPAVEGASQLQLMLHHPAGTGRFWISDIDVREVKLLPATPVPGQWVRDPRQPLSFTGLIPGTEVVLSAIADEKDDDITMNVGLSAPTEWLRANPTALVLSFRVPVDATGWRWGDYVHQERTIEPGKSYLHYAVIGGRQFREVSRFPLAAVAGPEHGLALAVPLTPTLFSRLRYDGGRYLCAEFDLGLAARTDKATEQVAFSFDLLRFAPRWGYREALASYYRRYPALFTSTAKEGGWWIGPTAKVRDIQDFGLQYSENHFTQADAAAANNAAGLYTCAYSEPWMWRIETLGPEIKDISQAPPPLSLLPRVEKDANLSANVMDDGDYWTAPRRESVRAFLNSVDYGADGKPLVRAIRSYGSTVIEFCTSALPKIRSDKWGEANRGLLSYKYETLEDQKRAAAAGARVEGVYFDSVGDWSDISAEDSRPDHFPFSDFPLTFSYATGAPAISGLSAMAQYMHFIREKGYITMANSDAEYAAYAAPYLDMVGAGENYYDGSDEEFSHDRAVAYHKSVSFGNTGMLEVSQEEAERRFRLLLFYHIYPGIFAGEPAALEAVRPVYQRYLPLMREMGKAGWEPVTHATVDDPAVWVERYGDCYFALRNPTDQARTVTLTLEEAPFSKTAAAATEVLSRQGMGLQRRGGMASAALSIAAQDTAVVRVEWQ